MTKLSEAAGGIAPAFVIPGIAPTLPRSLIDAAERVAAQTKIVATARAGAEVLASKAAELAARVKSLKDEIERADGSAAAAVAMGLGKADPARKAKIDAQMVELAGVERALAETTRAQSAAPLLFEQVRGPLTEAVSALKGEYSAVERDLAAWASDAEASLAHATAAVRHFVSGIHDHGAIAAQTESGDVPEGHPMALFDGLRELRAIFEAAWSADRPLVKPVAVDELTNLQRERVVSISGGRN